MTEEFTLAFAASQVVAAVLEDQLADEGDQQKQEDAERIEPERDTDTIDANQRAGCGSKARQCDGRCDCRGQRDDTRNARDRQCNRGTATIRRGSRDDERQAGESGQES